MIIQILIAIGFLLVMGCIVGLFCFAYCWLEMRLDPTYHYKVRKFVKKHFLEFIESSKLPKYDKYDGEPLEWWVSRVNRKKRTQSYDVYNGQQVINNPPYYEIVCMSTTYMQMIETNEHTNSYYSHHVFKIKLSVEKYKQAKKGTLSPEILIQKFTECNISRELVYCS